MRLKFHKGVVHTCQILSAIFEVLDPPKILLPHPFSLLERVLLKQMGQHTRNPYIQHYYYCSQYSLQVF